MSAIDFLIERLNSFSRAFPELIIRLEVSGVHAEFLIEISPSGEYKRNLTAKDLANLLFLDFRNEFPGKSIVFISPENFIKIETVAYEWNNGEMMTLKEWSINVPQSSINIR